MQVRIELSRADIKRLVKAEIDRLTNMNIPEEQIKIEVKSSQNYKSEWEFAHFRAVYEGDQA